MHRVNAEKRRKATLEAKQKEEHKERNLAVENEVAFFLASDLSESTLAAMGVILRKYLYGALDINELHYFELQKKILITPICDLLCQTLNAKNAKENSDDASPVWQPKDFESMVATLFEPFLKKEKVKKYCESLLITTANAKPKNSFYKAFYKLKYNFINRLAKISFFKDNNHLPLFAQLIDMHMYGILGQITLDVKERERAFSLSGQESYKEKLAIANKVVQSPLTESEYIEWHHKNFNYTFVEELSTFFLQIFIISVLLIAALKATETAAISMELRNKNHSYYSFSEMATYLVYATLGLAVYYRAIEVFTRRHEFSSEKALHLNLVSDLLSETILKHLARKKETTTEKGIVAFPKEKQKSSSIKTAVAEGTESKYFFNITKDTYKRLRQKRKIIKQSLTDTYDAHASSQIIPAPKPASPQQPPIIVWNVNGARYWFQEGNRLCHVYRFSARNDYFKSYAKNKYMLVETAHVRAIVKNKVKFEHFMDSLKNPEIVRTRGQTGGVGRPDPKAKNKDKTIKTKLANKSGVGHCGLFSTRIGSTESIYDGKKQVDVLYRPSYISAL